MASIERRRDKTGQISYRVRIRRKGSPDVSQTFRRMIDARAWASRMEVEISAGRGAPIHEARRRTLQDAIERYFSSPIFTGKAPKTQRQERQQLGWWGRQIGPHRLSDLTPALLTEYRDYLASYSKPSTVNRYLAVLRSLLTVVRREWSWLDENPMRDVVNLRSDPGRVRFLSDDERTRLLEACQDSSNRHLYPLVILAISTGARRGELLTLTWGQVDFERRLITFHHTKNRTSRSVHLSGLAYDVLSQHARVRRIDVDWVFPRKHRQDAPIFFDRAWKTALRASEVRDFTFHDLRHTAASYLAMNGASLLDISQILGHKNIAMTQRYAHLTESHTASIVERMNRTIFG